MNRPHYLRPRISATAIYEAVLWLLVFGVVVAVMVSGAAGQAVVRVENRVGMFGNQGSGAIIGDDGRTATVLSCWHLWAEGSGSTVVSLDDGRTFSGNLLGYDREADLAAVLIRSPSITPLTVAERDPSPGETVTRYGFGFGQFSSAPGKALGYTLTGSSGKAQTLAWAAGSRQGDSGGPVLNADNEVVAVVWGTDGQRSLGACCLRIRRFLASLRLTQCPGGWCHSTPNYYEQPIQPYQQPPATRQPQPRACDPEQPTPPVQPVPPKQPEPIAPVPPVPVPPDTKRLDEIAAAVAELRKAVDELAKRDPCEKLVAVTERHETAIVAVQQQVNELLAEPPVPGPKGDKGEDGKDGEQGPQGPKGDTGPAPEVDYDRIVAEVTARLEATTPAYFEITPRRSGK